MIRKKQLVKTVAFLLFCVCAFVCVIQTPQQQAFAMTEEEYQQQKDELAQKEAELAKQKEQIDADLNKAKNDVENEQAYQTQLKYQIQNIQDQISVLDSRISLLEADIQAKNQQIEQAQKDIDANKELLKKRLRAMYMTDDSTILSVLFGSSSFAEFLTVNETVQKVAEHDDQLIKDLTEKMEQIQADKQAIEESKAQVEADKASIAEKNNELQAAMAESNDRLYNLQGTEEEIAAERDRIIAAQEQADREMEELIRQYQAQNPSSELSPGGWLWPVSGYTNISDGYGWRDLYGKQQFHKGIDIPAAYGHPVRASKSGTVIRANWSSSYGNVVIVDHGGGYSTLYAHNSSLNVVVGQHVEQGETIAFIGSTGDSYGNHCHFEVRVNGVTDNPLNYVSR